MRSASMLTDGHAPRWRTQGAASSGATGWGRPAGRGARPEFGHVLAAAARSRAPGAPTMARASPSRGLQRRSRPRLAQLHEVCMPAAARVLEPVPVGTPGRVPWHSHVRRAHASPPCMAFCVKQATCTHQCSDPARATTHVLQKWHDMACGLPVVGARISDGIDSRACERRPRLGCTTTGAAHTKGIKVHTYFQSRW